MGHSHATFASFVKYLSPFIIIRPYPLAYTQTTCSPRCIGGLYELRFACAITRRFHPENVAIGIIFFRNSFFYWKITIARVKTVVLTARACVPSLCEISNEVSFCGLTSGVCTLISDVQRGTKSPKSINLPRSLSELC